MIRRMTGALVVCFAASPFVLADDEFSEATKLVGEWRAVEVERDGEKSTAYEVLNLRMVFIGNEIIIKSGDGTGRPRRKAFKLDPGQSPRTIDITSLDSQEAGQTAACIYKLDQGQLKICIPYAPTKDPSERPEEFMTKAGDGLMIFVLEREKLE